MGKVLELVLMAILAGFTADIIAGLVSHLFTLNRLGGGLR